MEKFLGLVFFLMVGGFVAVGFFGGVGWVCSGSFLPHHKEKESLFRGTFDAIAAYDGTRNI